MAGSKNTQTRVVGIVIDKMHPSLQLNFKQQGFYEKVSRLVKQMNNYYAGWNGTGSLQVLMY